MQNTNFIVYSIGIYVVWYGQLMDAGFRFLSICTSFDRSFDGSRCKVNLYYDYHEYEGCVCSFNLSTMIYVYL